MRHLFVMILMVSTLCSVVVADTTSKHSTGSLTIEGDTITVVTKLPFKVKAPAGYKLYFWTLPATWKHDARTVSTSATVTVSEAPEGSATVTVVAVPADFTPVELTLKVNVGKVTPPAPPVPPDDPLLKSLKAAYTSETDPQKADMVDRLGALYRQAAFVTDDASLKTWGDLSDKLASASKTLGVAGKVPAVQKVVAQHLVASGIPGKAGATVQLDATGRALARREFTRVGSALAGVK